MTDTRDSFEKVIADLRNVWMGRYSPETMRIRCNQLADRLTNLQAGAGDGVQGLIQAVNTVLGDRKCTLPPEGCDSLGLTDARIFRCDLLELSEALSNLDVRALDGFATIRLDKDQAKLLREILSEASDRIADGGYMSKEISGLTEHIYEAIDNAQATEGK